MIISSHRVLRWSITGKNPVLWLPIEVFCLSAETVETLRAVTAFHDFFDV